MKPLTNEQIWGVPEDEMPVDKKDYFDEAHEVIDKPDPQAAGPGEEAD